jgi:hypothetical protein
MAVSQDIPMTAVPAPKWWTKSYSLVLGLIVAGNLFADFFVFRVIDVNRTWVGPVIGYLLAQTFLMGFWLAMGGLQVLPRFAIVAVVVVAGAFATNLSLRNGDRETLVVLLSFGGTIVLGTHAVLLPLRWLLGWRVDFDQAYHARSLDRSLQIRLIHLLALTTAWALPFAISRLMPAEPDWPVFSLALGITGVVGSFPVAMVLLSTHRQWLWGIATIGIFGLASLAESVTRGGQAGQRRRPGRSLSRTKTMWCVT